MFKPLQAHSWHLHLSLCRLTASMCFNHFQTHSQHVLEALSPLNMAQQLSFCIFKTFLFSQLLFLNNLVSKEKLYPGILNQIFVPNHGETHLPRHGS
jgi:hypothetical protein